jgi:hypothetical protein
MATKNDILNFAFTKKVFTRKELITYLKGFNTEDLLSSLSEQLSRLLKSGQITRIKRGVYTLTGNTKSEFFINSSDEVKKIDLHLKKQFPFISYCIWDSTAIMPYMLHLPNIKFIFVDVERDATESVFNLLNIENTKRVYLMPTSTEFERYISGFNTLIIRNLVSESPLQNKEGINTPSIEKILVDIIGDVEFSFLKGAELHHVYNTIFERHNVNKNKLLRYATRRGRKEEVEQLLNANKYDSPRQP